METLAAKHFRFADFELDGAKRLLLKLGEPVALHSKTFDLLLALVECRGEVMSKDELLEKVWPGQFVEEGNLTVQVSTLRKVFGERAGEHQFIATVPGRGYSFVADVEEGTNGEIIVESHSLSRIVVEEEERNGEKEALRDSEPHAGRRAWIELLNANRYITLGAVIVLSALAVGGFLWQQQRFASSAIPFQQTTIKRLTTSGNVTHARISPDGKLYAYVTFANGQRTLWLGHVDGGEPKQLRPPTEIRYLSLKFSPDSSSLYYTTSVEADNGSLYRLPVFGGVPEKMRENVSSSFTIAPDGKRIAFVRSDRKSGEAALFISDINSENERELAKPPTKGRFVWHNPSWSPKGDFIAVGSATDENDTNFDVFLVSAGNGEIKRLTTKNWSDIGATSWLNDGSGLIVVASEKGGTLSQIWNVTIADGETRQLLSDLNNYGQTVSLPSDDSSMLLLQKQTQSNIFIATSKDISSGIQITSGSIGRADGFEGVEWTVDGRIIYTANADKNVTIWSMDSDGSNQKQLIPSGGRNNRPMPTGDGRYLVFQSNRGGHFAIWRANIDGSNLLQITGESVAAQPAVSPDGKWVVFVSDRDGPGTLWRTSIDGGEPMRLTEKKAQWPGVSPDGRFVACGYFAEGRKKLAILSIEGGEPLKLFDVPRLAEFAPGVVWAPDGNSVTYRDFANGIWQQSLDGGEPQRLDGLPQERLYAYGWSRDGSRFAYTRGTENSDVVLIRNSK